MLAPCLAGSAKDVGCTGIESGQFVPTVGTDDGDIAVNIHRKTEIVTANAVRRLKLGLLGPCSQDVLKNVSGADIKLGTDVVEISTHNRRIIRQGHGLPEAIVGNAILSQQLGLL